MAYPKAAWGMEIGSCAIKAIRLERDGDAVRVTDFAHIPHKKVLSTPDLDQDEMIRLTLGQFISQHSLEGEHLVMSVPGHAAFARFAKLPPVEPKKVPDIVKFEAVQQIPFPIEEVEWDYQTFQMEDSPEIEVGIFAITRERIQHKLGLYSELGISPEMLTLSPVSVYNAMGYDLNLAARPEPIIFLDIGTHATDVIVAEQGRCWIRTFPLGGTHFTEAIASAFKLGYSKAEKLKREAATSKYAKQIMQAMRPVFTDLLQDLQRSIGYYQSLHTEIELKTMVGLGSTFKIPGLRKFLGQQLQIDVIRLDEYKRIQVPGREAASFAENAVNMAPAYGLALQGVGLAPIDANLMPIKALRDQIWHAKTKWFGLAAAIMIIGSLALLWRPFSDKAKLGDDGVPTAVTEVLRQGEGYKKKYTDLKQKTNVGATATNMLSLLDYREIWPHLIQDAAAALASADPQTELLDGDINDLLAVDPKDRRLLLLRELTGQYSYQAEGEKPSRRIMVTMNVEVSHANSRNFLNESVAAWLRENASPEGDRADVPYRIIPETIALNFPLADVVDVTGSGQEEVVSGGPGRRPDKGGGSGVSNGRRSGGNGTVQGGGGGGRLRDTSGPKRGAPGQGSAGDSIVGGSGGGQLSNPGGSGADNPGRGGRTPGGTRRDPGGPDRGTDVQRDRGPLSERAPIPNRPPLYPAGTRIHRVPVTFEIEILDQKIKSSENVAQAEKTAGEEAIS